MREWFERNNVVLQGLSYCATIGTFLLLLLSYFG